MELHGSFPLTLDREGGRKWRVESEKKQIKENNNNIVNNNSDYDRICHDNSRDLKIA